MVSLKRRLEAAVGPENVSDRKRDLEARTGDESIFKGVAPSFIVRVSNAGEVRDLIRLANKERMPVIPVSSGIHFNGTSLPTQGGIMLDLSGMDRIIEVDVRNRRAMIEPGVRWGQLQDHLSEMEMVAVNPLFPHPEQSVVTSYLERQPPIIPKFEYAEPISTLEMVLPSGDLLRTGSAASPGAPFDTVADMVCPYGPGLDFYRLFQGAQGTLGVVTWMNIKVEYFSPLRKTYTVANGKLSELLSFVHRIQRLMIGNACFILKRPDLAAIASNGDRHHMEEMAEEAETWTAVIQIAGARWRPEERIAYQDKAFHEICRDMEMTPRESLTLSGKRCDLLERCLHRPWSREKTYWKYLKRGGCHSVAFHTTKEKLPGLVEGADEILSRNGYGGDGYGMYVQPLEYGRAYYCCLHLFYSTGDEGQVNRMIKIDEILNRALFLSGSLFNTPYGAQAPLTYDHATMYTETLRKVKDIFDPVGIMNPGRLCF